MPQHIRDTVTGDLRGDGVPYTGTATTTAGGIPEWHADNAPITGPAQIWRIDRDGNPTLFATYDSNSRTWTQK